MIQPTEQEKYNILLSIIKDAIGFKVRTTVRTKPSKTRQEIDGSTDIHNQSILITLKENMVEDDWSEAASVLLHEYGHAENYTLSETEAWKNADRLIAKFSWLSPWAYDDIKARDLAIYRAMYARPRRSMPGFTL